MNSNGNNVVGLIPVRLESTRLPHKALKDICGIPAIVHVYKRCLLAKKLNAVYVVTDSEEIASVVRKYSGEVILTGEHQNGSERIYEASRKLKCSLIINIQGDEILVKPNHVDAIVKEMLDNNKINYAFGVTPYKKVNQKQDFKVVVDKKGYVLYCSREDIPSSSIEHDENRLKAVFIVGFTKNSLKKFVVWGKSPNEKREPNEFLRILDNGGKIKSVLLDDAHISLDTNSDLKEIHEIMGKDKLVNQLCG